MQINQAAAKVKYLLFIFLIFSIFSCKKNSVIDIKNLGLSGNGSEKFVSEHSPTLISIKDEIIVRLSSPSDKEKVVFGAELGSGIASISPSAKGKFVWKDNTTIAFVPAEKLSSNTAYKIDIDLKKLYNRVDENVSTISLAVATIKQNISLIEEGIEYEVGSNGEENLVLQGQIQASDYIENEAVEKMLTAQQSNQNLAIEWSHLSDKQHAFTIKGIKRKDKDENLELSYDGGAEDNDFKGKRELLIIKKGDFVFIEGKVKDQDGKRVDLIFSDPLQNPQNLSGLVTINGSTNPVNYEISGNKIIVYFDNEISGTFTIGIDKNIKNKSGKSLPSSLNESYSFTPSKPEVTMLRKGVILPETDRIWLPFQAKNLKYVDIAITKIYQNNVLQFLQYNDFDYAYNLTPVGKEIVKEKVDLRAINPQSNKSKSIKYTLDLSRMVNADKGSIYYVNISYKKEYVEESPCPKTEEDVANNAEEEGDDGEYYDEDYIENDDPCMNNYYPSPVGSFIHASNIALIAKRQPDNTIHIVASDIKTAEPLAATEIEVYDFQKQILSKITTDDKGLARTNNGDEPAFIIAKKNGEYGYLNIRSEYALTTSEFDVSGKELKTGLDAFIYGERGVYRPGDSLHINVMLYNHNSKQSVTNNYPVRLKVEDSRGKLQYDKVSTNNIDHIYYFPIATRDNANTGNWKITAELGNEKFYKTIKVETVKPNRLKISYANEKSDLKYYEEPTLNFESKWLHGASAEGLQASADVTLSERDISFYGYKSYSFKDPARNTEYINSRVYEGNLNSEGKASFKINNDENLLPGGGLGVTLKTRVYEKSGNYSEDYTYFEAHKYNSYVGIKLPQSDWGGHYFKSGTKQSFPVVSVNTAGKPLGNRKISVGLYKAEWDWWYNESNYNIMKYNSAIHVGALKTFNIKTDAKGLANFTQEFEDDGNYMIRICDTESGHCTGDFFYTSRWGNPPSNNGAAQLLTITTDKEVYNVGEEIKMRIPSNVNSKILVSIEKGSTVDQIMKLVGKDKETVISIPVTKEMSPNIYLHTSLIQPYATNEKGLPLRMYGIANVKINDPSKTLTPVIAAPTVLSPGEKFTVSVSEKNGKDMAYTIAIVDEGLLGLTRFKTPNPIDHFFAKQSLGINTWDMYDKVMNPYGQDIENIFSIGGDEDATNLNTVKKANRFIPTVKYAGPFKVGKGGKNNHSFTINNYVGSVRIMVVAKNMESFGNAEKTCPVKKDLMVQNTLPRVLSPGDELTLASNVFAMSNKIKNVNLTANHNTYFSPVGSKNTSLSFAKEGDQLHNFTFKTANAIGVGKLGSIATSGSLTTKEETEIEIRNPNPPRSEFKDIVIEAGKSADIPFTLFGSMGTNTAELEMSNAPLINISKRLNYLIQYPYGCIEQTTSSAFPQLYLADMTDLSPARKAKITDNVNKAIQRIALFQVSNGGFAYWPGSNYAEDWATTYAGHFLLEAKAKAYYVPESLIKKWAEYQKGKANAFNGTYDYNQHAQAFRLYTLAKYGKPEMGAMNQLRNQKNLDISSLHTLAAAYAVIGKKDVAKEIMNIKKAEVAYGYSRDYDYYTYGSELRNKAMLLEAQYEIGDQNNALSTAKTLVQNLNSNMWYNTQAVSYAMMAIQKFYNAQKGGSLTASYVHNGKTNAINTIKKVSLQELSIDQSKKNQSVKISNTSNGKLFVRLVYSGKEEVSKGLAAIANNHISMNVRYTDSNNKAIDIKNIPQGTNVTARIDIINNGSFSYKIENMALSFIVPAGWEINNERLAGIDRTAQGITYQDIRDDRVNSFFTLVKNKPVSVSIPLTASYAGNFYFPPVRCEAMYHNEVFVMTSSNYVTVTPSIGIAGKKDEQ